MICWNITILKTSCDLKYFMWLEKEWLSCHSSKCIRVKCKCHINLIPISSFKSIWSSSLRAEHCICFNFLFEFLFSFQNFIPYFYINFLNLLILERGGRERNIDLWFHLFMHSLVASCMCLDQESNPQSWCSGTML